MMGVKAVSFEVLLFGFVWFAFSVDHNIIHVDGEPSLCHFGVEDGVHHHLKGGWGVCESEEHYCWFE